MRRAASDSTLNIHYMRMKRSRILLHAHLSTQNMWREPDMNKSNTGTILLLVLMSLYLIAIERRLSDVRADVHTISNDLEITTQWKSSGESSELSWKKNHSESTLTA